MIPYLDSETRYWESVYQQGIAFEQAGKMDEAIALYQTIPLHQKAARAREGLSLPAGGRRACRRATLTEAAAQFALAGDYLDAADANPVRIGTTRPTAAFAAGDYQTAIDLLREIGDYQDSADKLKQARYAIREGRAGRGRLRTGGAALRRAWRLSGQRGHGQSGALRAGKSRAGRAESTTRPRSCSRRWATMRTARTLAHQAQYTKAKAAFDTADYDTAIALFTALGDFQDSADMANQARYAQAEAAFAAAEYDTAITLFTALGDYQDSADRIA